jgi:hypothetical protein
MPHGYVRWMKICGRYGHGCNDWLLGAVQMPNGPFHVVAGMLNGHEVRPDDGNQGRVAHDGGPLHLNVMYRGGVSNGGGVPASHGYVFVLSGRIFF